MSLIGYHETFDEIEKAVTRDKLNCVQIFVAGPKTTKIMSRYSNGTKCKKIKEKFDKLGITIFIHGSYVDYPWKGNPLPLEGIRRELIVGDALGAKGVVVHLPNMPYETVAKYVDKLMKKEGVKATKTPLLLELNHNKASPHTLETPEKIGAFLKKLSKNPHVDKLGVCLDTAHIFSSGYDLSSAAAAKKYIKAIEPYAHLIKLLHLNDSGSRLGSGYDRHEPFTSKDGVMWGSKVKSLSGALKNYDKKEFQKCGAYIFAKAAIKNGWPIMLERTRTENDSVKKELAILREL
nr:endonuclease IV [Kaumoebavirus]